MKVSYRGLLLAALHVALVLTLGAKLLIDRARFPRVWVQAAPYDPSLPIRGRYVRLRIVEGTQAGAVRVDTSEPVVFFIPENVPDPSRRPPGEQLWVEVTAPKKGPPRPIRLGVKKDGVLTPLALD